MDIASSVYRLAISLWLGGMALFTFLVTPRIFGTQSRDAAGTIVGAIFPLYFRYGLVLTGVALVARIVAGEAWPGGRRLAGTALLAAAVALTSIQAYGLEPRMAAAKRAVASLESAHSEDPVRRTFSRLHGISMALNLILILDGAVLVAGYEYFRKQAYRL
jgi:hypothetical protein